MSHVQLFLRAVLTTTLGLALYTLVMGRYCTATSPCEWSIIIPVIALAVGIHVLPTYFSSVWVCHGVMAMFNFFIGRTIDSFWTASFTMLCGLVLWAFFFDLMVYQERRGPPEEKVLESEEESTNVYVLRFIFMTPWGFGLFLWFAAKGEVMGMVAALASWALVAFLMASYLDHASRKRWVKSRKGFQGAAIA